MIEFIRRRGFIIALILVLLIGFIIRIWNISNNPAGFFCDEASVGYNSYKILTTGRDEWGVKLPIFFKAFGEYKNPLDIYATTLPIAIFGLNEFSVRLTSIFFSMLTAITFYFIGRLIKNKYFGLLLTTLYLITPWSIHLSRINLEGFDIYLFLLLVSLYLLLNFLKHKKKKDIFLFSIFLGLSAYSYFPSRIVTPILAIEVFLYLITHFKNKKIIVSSFFIYIAFLLPLIFHFTSGGGLSRWQQVSLFNQKDISPINKIVKSYWLHFSPDYLFVKGDIDMTGQFISRHSVRGVGELYLWQAPFIIIGLFLALKNIKKLENFYFIILLILYPVPSSITTDLTPQATRSLTGLLPLTYLTILGLSATVALFKNKKIKNLVIILFLIIISFYFLNLLKIYKYYPSYSSDYWGWQYGPKEIVSYFKTNNKKYDDLYMAGDFNAPYIFLKFYDPENSCQNCFIGGEDRYDHNKKQLFAMTPFELSKISWKYKVLKIIQYPNKDTAFVIIEH